MNLPLLYMLSAALLRVLQAPLLVLWFNASKRLEASPYARGVSLALIGAQLVLFAISAWSSGVSLVAQGTGLDEFTRVQLYNVAAVVLSGVGWMFFGHRATKLAPL